MLVHLAMILSTVNGWVLPSDLDTAHDSPLSPHESAITGDVDSARDRRRLASDCNEGWSVKPPRLLSPLPITVPLPLCPQRFIIRDIVR